MAYRNKNTLFLTAGIFFLLLLSITSIFIGKYPLTLTGLLSGDSLQWRVFLTLRASRAVIGAVGGFVLGVTGFVYQTVFKNPLASPDIIGVSSGASAGAAFGILFLSGSMAVTASAFAGAVCAVILSFVCQRRPEHRACRDCRPQPVTDRPCLSEINCRSRKTACVH